jgi:hypothetical protein
MWPAAGSIGRAVHAYDGGHGPPYEKLDAVFSSDESVRKTHPTKNFSGQRTFQEKNPGSRPGLFSLQRFV